MIYSFKVQLDRDCHHDNDQQHRQWQDGDGTTNNDWMVSGTVPKTLCWNIVVFCVDGKLFYLFTFHMITFTLMTFFRSHHTTYTTTTDDSRQMDGAAALQNTSTSGCHRLGPRLHVSTRRPKTRRWKTSTCFGLILVSCFPYTFLKWYSHWWLFYIDTTRLRLPPWQRPTTLTMDD